MPQIPNALISRTPRVFRTRDLASTYVNPTAEITRLVEQGVVVRVARGYYALVPPQWVAAGGWRPDLEAVALGLAVADYGSLRVALMGPSAARLLGALPRAIAVATVLVPKQRPPLITAWGEIVFHRRDAGRLDLQRVDTDLASGYQTTAEQTILDLARWGDAWDLSPALVVEAIVALAARADWDLLHDLAVQQREPAAYMRARRLSHQVVPDAPELRVRGTGQPRSLEPVAGVGDGASSAGR